MLTILELANHFGMKTIYGTLNALQREIKVPRLDRPGLQLLGMFNYHEKERLLLLGNKEIDLIKKDNTDLIYKNCLKLFSDSCPGIIITQGNKCPEAILNAAKEKDVPVFLSDNDTSFLSSSIYIYLSEALAPETSIHACFLKIYGIGVALMGDSGVGKSEISLELIKKGHTLIADDRINIKDVRGKLIGTCPESIYGMMEVRGIGIIDVSKMFGINSLSQKSNLQLVIKLVHQNTAENIERIGMNDDHIDILNEKIPLITIPVSPARSIAEIIETAVTNFKLKEYGYDTGYEFTKRLQEIHDKKRDDLMKETNDKSSLNKETK